MYQYIQLTRGFITLVDDDLIDCLNRHLWYASGLEGRPARRLKEPGRRLIYMYHQIMDVKPWELSQQKLVVDHINGDPLDNRRANLRIVTASVNNLNSDRHRLRKGISYDSTHDRFKVYIDQPGSSRINVGTYKTMQEAIEARDHARS